MEAVEKYTQEGTMRAIIQSEVEAPQAPATMTATEATLKGTPTKDKVVINSKGSDKVVPCSRNSSGRRISSKRASSRTSSDSRGLGVCSNSHSLRSSMEWVSSNSSNSPNTWCKTKTSSTLQSKGRGSSQIPLSKSLPQKSYASFSWQEVATAGPSARILTTFLTILASTYTPQAHVKKVICASFHTRFSNQLTKLIVSSMTMSSSSMTFWETKAKPIWATTLSTDRERKMMLEPDSRCKMSWSLSQCWGARTSYWEMEASTGRIVTAIKATTQLRISIRHLSLARCKAKVSRSCLVTKTKWRSRSTTSFSQITC